MKTCSKCHVAKASECFRATGNQCKVCMNAMMMELYYRQRRTIDGQARILYKGCKQRHRKKHEGELITFGRFNAIYLAQGGVCVETGVPFDFASKDLMPSPDRIDNSVGYVDGNIRFVTWRVNGMRKNLPVERFQSTCMEVAYPNASRLVAAVTTTADSMVRLKMVHHNCKHTHEKKKKYEGKLITFERFEAIYQAQNGVCADTGVPFDWASKDLMPSADRIDNEVGYVDGNIRFVTWRVNNMRGGLSVEDFYATCVQVVNRNKRKFDAASA